MRRLAALWLALWLAAPATAQGVPVRAGAHDGFDRLTIDLPRRTGYRIERREGGAALLFEDRALRFDLSAAFDRIGRDRLRALAAPEGQGRLVLDLGCDCALRPFWHGARMLVLDIADPPAAPTAPPAAPVLPFAPAAPSVAALPARLAPVPPRAAPAVAAEPPPPDLAQMRETLIHQLARAASQGLVTLAPGAAPSPADPRAPAPGPARPDARPEAGPPALRAHTAMDRDIAAARPPAEAGETASCPDPALLDVAAWGDPAGLVAGLGRLHRGLYAEFDTIEPGAARDLARLYIHHGFGAEARQMLALLPAPGPEAPWLEDLARIVDHAPASPALAALTGCGAPAVLWALLAGPGIDPGTVFDHRALERSFAALPGPLRADLGPGLVRRLLAAGHADTAERLQRLAERVAPPGDPGTALARAGLAAHRATPGDGPGDAALDAIARTNSDEAAEALARAIEGALARGAPVTPDQARLAGALAQERRATPMGDRLAVAHVAGLAAAGAFEEAAAEATRFADASPGLAAKMARPILLGAAESADDITFLRLVLPGRLLAPATMDPPLAAAIAERLLRAGFVEAAARHAPDDPDDPTLRRLRAEIALARGRPAEAERVLLGLEGPEALRLRARARARQGNHAAARALFAASGATLEADRAALLMRDPAALASASDPLLRDLAPVLAGPGRAGTDTPDRPLARAAALLEQTQAAQAVLARLLAERPAPAAAAR
ncbi:MAG: hypothetical protein CMN17_14635 [Roseovarius sp.]|nr:hypothetical protein [Roseovarius sp.]